MELRDLKFNYKRLNVNFNNLNIIKYIVFYEIDTNSDNIYIF